MNRVSMDDDEDDGAMEDIEPMDGLSNIPIHTKLSVSTSTELPDIEERMQAVSTFNKTSPQSTAITSKLAPYCDHASCRRLIQEVLDIDNCSHSGYISKKKGILQKRRRYFILAQGHLSYWEDKSEVGRVLALGILHLDGSLVLDRAPDSLKFTIESGPKRKYTLEADCREDKQTWIRAIRVESGAKALEANTKLHHPAYCEACSSYVDLDEFTLGAMVGWLEKQGGTIKTWKRRWCVLSSKTPHMAYFHNETDVSSYKPIKFLVHVDASKVEERPALKGKNHMFAVPMESRVFIFNAPTLEDYKAWLVELRRHCSK